MDSNSAHPHVPARALIESSYITELDEELLSPNISSNIEVSLFELLQILSELREWSGEFWGPMISKWLLSLQFIWQSTKFMDSFYLKGSSVLMMSCSAKSNFLELSCPGFHHYFGFQKVEISVSFLYLKAHCEVIAFNFWWKQLGSSWIHLFKKQSI